MRDTDALEYGSWEHMTQRCYNPNDKKYHLYGGKGVSIYFPWKKSFKEFFAYMGPKPTKHHSIDRINSDGNYEPGNVRWATALEQNRHLKGSNSFKNIAGTVIRNWLVTDVNEGTRHGARWLCRCVKGCGAEKKIYASNLNANNVAECKCNKVGV